VEFKGGGSGLSLMATIFVENVVVFFALQIIRQTSFSGYLLLFLKTAQAERMKRRMICISLIHQ
jgi:hypothetical protein